ncbi:uncharacterized protein [Scyliorhinus torazame]|uniref:uncharacterized protein isoform X1 n=1 Tax=Scyliorhinus torazame TaxID=75743 RepID=UPI003B5BD019
MSTAEDPNLKTREEKDADLDRKIEALRKKNEALMKRHKEIEEDRRKAEEDGISVTNRKPRHEAEHDRKWSEKDILTVTVDLSKSPSEKRMVNDRKPVNSHRGNQESPGRRPWACGPNSPDPRQAADRGSHHRSPGNRPDRVMWADHPDRGPRGLSGHESPGGEKPNRGGHTRRGRGGGGGDGGGGGTGSVSPQDRRVKEWEEKRRQNIEQMNEEMEKIAEYERNQMDGSGEKNPMRNFLDDPRRLGSLPDADRKDGSRRHIRNWGGPDFDKVKTGLDRDKDWQGRRSGSKGSVDMTLSMTGRERAEYMRWKKERERIDQERLARHRNATGQWRREWDAEKTESMFKDNPGSSENFEGGSKRDERRPPKPPTISDFVAHSRDKDSRRGKDKRGGKNYSMHDDRWEAGEAAHEPKQISEDQQEKRFKGKPAQDVKLSELKANKEELLVDAVDDEDEWEDASDDEEEIVGEDVSDSDGELEETKELEEKQEAKGIKEEVEMEVETVQHVSRSPEIDAKQQRVRKARESPKLHIPPMEETVQFKETAPKPLSPFSLEEYHPVKDWAEEMETSSPRCNVEQNPLQTVNTAKEECKVENKQGDVAADRESLPSDVQTGMEPVSVREPSPLQYGTESNQPTAEILNAHVDPDIRDGDQSSDSATIVATQAATEEELKQQEVNRREDGFLEPSTRTTRSTDCVEDNEHSSGAVRITSYETVCFRSPRALE